MSSDVNAGQRDRREHAPRPLVGEAVLGAARGASSETGLREHLDRSSANPLKQVLALPFGSAPLGSEQGREFLQQRLAFYSKSLFFMGAFAFVAMASIQGVVAGTATWARLLNHESFWHAVGTLSPLFAWLLVRGRPISARGLFIFDGTCTVAVLSAYATMAMHGARVVPERAAFVMTLITVCTVMWRAITIPSTPGHTLAVTGLASLPVLALTYFATLHYPSPGGLSAPAATAFIGVWVVLSLAVCGIASRIIYGLCVQVAQARQLGQYVLDELIGEGGMGVVYKARHALLRRPTAIKLILPDRTSPQALRRFEREVQLTAMLTHPNTVNIYDYGHTAEGTLYYAMELLDGINLEELVEWFGPQSPERVAHILQQVAGSLSEAHGVGLVHRDIKPANVILCQRGGQSEVAKVVDFGLVKDVTVMGGADPTLTNTNTILGTPLYLAPEAILAPDSIDARSDLYALGAVGYYLLTGQPVFSGVSMVEICVQHCHKEPLAPSERLGTALPERLEGLVLRCLRKKPEDRPQSAEALLQELGSVGVPDWTREQSASWWRHHAAELNTHKSSGRQARNSGKSRDTLVVDIGARMRV